MEKMPSAIVRQRIGPSLRGRLVCGVCWRILQRHSFTIARSEGPRRLCYKCVVVRCRRMGLPVPSRHDATRRAKKHPPEPQVSRGSHLSEKPPGDS